ncbi:MAG: hypothetical protein KGN32_05340 [Burkholderiales bacterium]|nr:hypothetical protein [Burkholderiales bacterium]
MASTENHQIDRLTMKKVFIFTILPSSIVLFILLAVVQYVAPDRESEIQRMPPRTGIYRCCEATGRYSRSWVNDVVAECNRFTYFAFLGTNRNDCGFKEKIDGKSVEIEEVLLPAFPKPSPVVVSMKSKEETYIQFSNERILDLWSTQSRWGAIFTAFIFGAVMFSIQKVLQLKKLKQHQGGNK